MRVIGAHLLNKTVTVTRPSYASNSQGGDTETFVQHPTDSTIKMRYYAATGSDRIIAGREDEKISHIAYVLPSVDIVRADRLAVDSKTFDVIAALLPSNAHHIKLMLLEV